MISFNDKLEVTDNDLRILSENWYDKLQSEVGEKTAFVEGFKSALREIKKLNKEFFIKNSCEHNWVSSVAYKGATVCSKCNVYK